MGDFIEARRPASAMPAGVAGNRTPRLRVRGLSAGYGGRTVLHDVDFDAAPGRVTVLVGPNGCGKSTLLKAMARVLRPSAGEVLLDGASLHDLPTRRVARALALLPQGPTPPEGLTARELVAQGRFPHQTLFRQWSAEDARAVDEAMRAADVAKFADRPIAALSGGERQRCWIAMVLAQETELLLLDEPTTFLDLKGQIDVMRLLRRIARTEGRTLVAVLHELNLAAAFADEIVMMRDGRVRAAGAPEDVMTPPVLHDVFGLDAQMLRDPETGRPICVPRTGPETPA